jgi:putative chitinase
MLLKRGSVGEEVKKLQTRLGLNPDGSFGPNTENKVKEWQAQNNLPSNGTVDDLTWESLFPALNEPVNNLSPGLLKIESLHGHLPEAVIAQIPDTAAKFNISNDLRLAHFLAQCGHESAGFTRVTENLNYSADGLKKHFSKYIPDELIAAYANDAVKIGSRVYANRMGNGDEASGEGYKYRGRGFIQMTGKDNYTLFARFIGEDTVANPDLVATKYPLASAAFYFDSNHLWSICDKGDTVEVVTALTQRINNGLLGLPERLSHFNEFNSLLA